MLQLMSFAFFATVLAISIAAIIGTVRAEMASILKALDIAPRDRRPQPPAPARQVRVIRQPMARPVMRTMLHAAA